MKTKTKAFFVLMFFSLVLIFIVFWFYYQTVMIPENESIQNNQDFVQEKSNFEQVLGEIVTDIEKKIDLEGSVTDDIVVDESNIIEEHNQKITTENETISNNHQEIVIELKYSLSNRDYQYGFDIPAVSFNDSDTILLELYKDTAEEHISIYLDEKFISEQFLKNKYQIISTYDAINMPTYEPKEINKIALTEVLENELITIVESFSVQEIEVSDTGFSLILSSEVSTDLHQPIYVELQNNFQSSYPDQLHQYSHQRKYFQFENEGLTSTIGFRTENLSADSQSSIKVCVIASICNTIPITINF